MTIVRPLLLADGGMRSREVLQVPDTARTTTPDGTAWGFAKPVRAITPGATWTISANKPASTPLDLANHAYMIYCLEGEDQLRALAQEDWPPAGGVICPLAWVDSHHDLTPRLLTPPLIIGGGVLCLGAPMWLDVFDAHSVLIGIQNLAFTLVWPNGSYIAVAAGQFIARSSADGSGHLAVGASGAGILSARAGDTQPAGTVLVATVTFTPRSLDGWLTGPFPTGSLTNGGLGMGAVIGPNDAASFGASATLVRSDNVTSYSPSHDFALTGDSCFPGHTGQWWNTNIIGSYPFSMPFEWAAIPTDGFTAFALSPSYADPWCFLALTFGWTTAATVPVFGRSLPAGQVYGVSWGFSGPQTYPVNAGSPSTIYDVADDSTDAIVIWSSQPNAVTATLDPPAIGPIRSTLITGPNVTIDTNCVPIWPLWMTKEDANSIVAFDGTGTVQATYTGNGLSSPLMARQVSATEVWVANTDTNTISRFTLAGGSAGPPIADPTLTLPYDITVVGAVVWVSNSGNGTITRLHLDGSSAGSPLTVGSGSTGPGPMVLVPANYGGAGNPAQVLVVDQNVNPTVTYRFNTDGSVGGSPIPSSGSATVNGLFVPPYDAAHPTTSVVWATYFDGSASPGIEFHAIPSYGTITAGPVPSDLPNGLALLGSDILIATRGGTINRFKRDGTRHLPDFVSSAGFAFGLCSVSVTFP